jgi:hypothetical protein
MDRIPLVVLIMNAEIDPLDVMSPMDKIPLVP